MPFESMLHVLHGNKVIFIVIGIGIQSIYTSEFLHFVIYNLLGCFLISFIIHEIMGHCQEIFACIFAETLPNMP